MSEVRTSGGLNPHITNLALRAGGLRVASIRLSSFSPRGQETAFWTRSSMGPTDMEGGGEIYVPIGSQISIPVSYFKHPWLPI